MAQEASNIRAMVLKFLHYWACRAQTDIVSCGLDLQTTAIRNSHQTLDAKGATCLVNRAQNALEGAVRLLDVLRHTFLCLYIIRIENIARLHSSACHPQTAMPKYAQRRWIELFPPPR